MLCLNGNRRVCKLAARLLQCAARVCSNALPANSTLQLWSGFQALFNFAAGTYVPGELYAFWASAINGVGAGPACLSYSYRAPPG